MTLGTEWLIDASGCDPATRADIKHLQTVFDRIIGDLDLHVLGEVAWHKFASPGGVRGMAVLSDSHRECHTCAVFRAATFNLYCCRDRAIWPWEQMLKEMLGSSHVTVRTFERIALQAGGSAR